MTDRVALDTTMLGAPGFVGSLNDSGLQEPQQSLTRDGLVARSAVSVDFAAGTQPALVASGPTTVVPFAEDGALLVQRSTTNRAPVPFVGFSPWPTRWESPTATVLPTSTARRLDVRFTREAGGFGIVKTAMLGTFNYDTLLTATITVGPASDGTAVFVGMGTVNEDGGLHGYLPVASPITSGERVTLRVKAADAPRGIGFYVIEQSGAAVVGSTVVVSIEDVVFEGAPSGRTNDLFQPPALLEGTWNGSVHTPGAYAAPTLKVPAEDGDYIAVAQTDKAGVLALNASVSGGQLDFGALLGTFAVRALNLFPRERYRPADLALIDPPRWLSIVGKGTPGRVSRALRRALERKEGTLHSAASATAYARMPAGKTRISVAENRRSLVRFDLAANEVAEGDENGGNPTNSRAELVDVLPAPQGTRITKSFQFVKWQSAVPGESHIILDQERYTNVVGDNSALGPDIMVSLFPNTDGTWKLTLHTQYDAANPGPAGKWGLASTILPAVAAGEVHHVYYEATIGYGADQPGLLGVWVDGVNVRPVQSTLVGYAKAEGPQPHFGQYRSINPLNQRSVVDFHNWERVLDTSGTADGPLRSRVLLPLPLQDDATAQAAAVEQQPSAAPVSDQTSAALIRREDSEMRAAITEGFVQHLTSSGIGGSQHARINAALAAPNPAGVGVQKIVRLCGKFWISGRIEVPSYVTLDTTEAEIHGLPGLNGNLIVNSNVDPERVGANDATVTMGGTTITSASAGFTAADVGRQVGVQAKAEQGMSAYGTITAVANGVATFSGLVIRPETEGKVWVHRPRQQHIYIVGAGGGVIDRHANLGSQWTTHTVRLRRVDSCGVSGVAFRSTDGKYSVSFGDVTNSFATDLHFDTHSDGVHITGPSRRGYYANLRGRTGDDMLAFTGVDYTSYNDVIGPITGFVAEGLFPDGSLAALKITGGSVTGGTVRGIYGTTQTRPIAYCGDLTGPSYAADIHVSDVDVVVVGPKAATEPVVQMFSGSGSSPFTGDRLTFERLRSHRAGAASGAVVQIDGGNGTSIGDLTVDGVSISATGSGTSILTTTGPIKRAIVKRATIASGTSAAHGIRVNAGGSVDELVLEEPLVNNEGGSIAAIYVAATGALKRATIRGGTVNAFIYSETTAAIALALIVAYSRTTAGVLSAIATSGPMVVAASSATIEAPAGGQMAFRQGTPTASFDISGTLSLVGGSFGVTLGSGVTTRAATVRSFGIPIRVDHAAKVAGAMAYNAQTIGTMPVGPVTCDGTSWKHLFSGTTF